VVWRGKPAFIRHRTEAEIEAARRDDAAPMPDPQPDAARVERPEWLVVMGICLHLGCVPRGQRPTDSKGEYGGWFCPCHGSPAASATARRRTTSRYPSTRSSTRPRFASVKERTMAAPHWKYGAIRWFDERFPMFTAAHHQLYEYPMPRNLNYWWSFGSIAGVTLVVMIFSGIFLASSTTPTSITRSTASNASCATSTTAG
jgi:hypothetical protein